MCMCDLWDSILVTMPSVRSYTDRKLCGVLLSTACLMDPEIPVLWSRQNNVLS